MQHISTASILQLWNDIEIQFMLLLSFTIQLYLFFVGGLRQRHNNMLFALSIWLAYLGADLVAVYALGLLSRYPRDKNSLAFFWAPFLLVHLGGQDSINAFAVEDINLWLRHFLNLLGEVSLALYVCWKFIGQGNSEILAPAVFIFVAGVIKYGERTWALKCGNQNSLWSSKTEDGENKRESLVGEDNYTNILCYAFKTVPFIRGLFAGRTIFQMGNKARDSLCQDFAKFQELEPKLKILEVELGLMYDVLYTKAMVTQTWAGTILRCLAQSSMVITFVLFHANKKGKYYRGDVMVTYALLTGGLFMEVCSLFMVLMSPWTWASLKAWNCKLLSYMSWFFFKIRRPEERRWWSSNIGQYNFIMSLVRDRSNSVVKAFSRAMHTIGLDNIWRMLRHSKNVKANIEITKCVIEWSTKTSLEEVPNLGSSLEYILRGPFENAIIQLHLFTDLHIRIRNEVSASADDPSIAGNIYICEKISNYMLYLLVFYPSMLPISGSAQDALELFSKKINCTSERKILYEVRYSGLQSQGSIFVHLYSILEYAQSLPFDISLEKIKEMWIRLLVYAACKSRPAMHAQQLGKGGELLTFIWLYLGAHHAFGDTARQFELISPSRENEGAELVVGDSMVPIQGYRAYLFDFQR